MVFEDKNKYCKVFLCIGKLVISISKLVFWKNGQKLPFSDSAGIEPGSK